MLTVARKHAYQCDIDVYASGRRNMRGDEARKLCPELQIVQVPTANGKADLTAYRAAGKEVRTRGLL